MKIAVLGTGIVGQTLGAKLIAGGHQVTMGSRSADHQGALEWAAARGSRSSVATFRDAAQGSELVINATSGAASLAALGAAGSASLDGKVLVDVANPLDFSKGFPPTLSVVNDDSLGERIQAAFPGARVVKTLNTLSAPVMVDPSLVPGHHNLFLSGNDAEAKAQVAGLLQSFGWPPEDILDLGDITTARGTEMWLPLWLRLFGVVGSPNFNLGVLRG
ncbi:MAG: NADPH-dependent F420 reductase [Candidatus Dormibacteria bacterium]